MAAGRKSGPEGIEIRSVYLNARYSSALHSSSNARAAIPGHLAEPPSASCGAKPHGEPNLNRKKRAIELTLNFLRHYIALPLQGSFRTAVTDLAEQFESDQIWRLSHYRFGSASYATTDLFDKRALEIYASLGLEPLASLPAEKEDLLLQFRLNSALAKQSWSRKSAVLREEDAALELANALAVLVIRIIRYLIAYLHQQHFTELQSLPNLPDLYSTRNSNDPSIANRITALRHTRLHSSFVDWLQSHWVDLLSIAPVRLDRKRTESPIKNAASDNDDFHSHSATDNDDDYSVDDPAKQLLTYIEIHVVDEDGNPVTKGRYRLELTDGSIRKGILPPDGHIRIDSIPPGSCDFKIFQMLDFGAAENEVTRSWEWRATSAVSAPEDNVADHHSANKIEDHHLPRKD
jgi:hypothetical protein